MKAVRNIVSERALCPTHFNNETNQFERVRVNAYMWSTILFIDDIKRDLVQKMKGWI